MPIDQRVDQLTIALPQPDDLGYFVRDPGGTPLDRAFEWTQAEIALRALTPATDRVPYFDGATSAALATLTPFARSLLDDANAAAARATLDVDQAGTDNSTDVTLAGALDYLTIAGQVITLNAIDLTTDVVGDLPVADGGTGASAAAAARANLGAAPLDATFITQVANGELSNEQALAPLTTGILKNTTTTGVLSIAAEGTDFSLLPVVDETPLVFQTGTPANTLTFDVSALTGPGVATWPDASLTVAGLQVPNVFTVGQMIDGSADEVQLAVQMDAAQVSNAFEIQDSGSNILSGADERGILFSDGDSVDTNVFIGKDTGNVAATGGNNVAIGNTCLPVLTTGVRNVALGDTSLPNCTTGQQNMGIGQDALSSLTSGVQNVAVGGTTLNGITTTGQNVAIGVAALANLSSGSENIGIGKSALQNQTGGASNVGIGAFAMGLGSGGGSQNTIIGGHAARGVTGSNNTIVGYRAGRASGAINECVFLGYRAGRNETTSNRLYISNSDTSTPLIYGEFDNGLLKFYEENTDTDVVHDVLFLIHNSSDIPANNFGVGLKLQLHSSTDKEQDAARMASAWNDATHISRSADIVFYAVHNAAALAEVARMKSDGDLIIAGNLQITGNDEVRFYDNGNYVGFEAPALSGDQIWVLPSADGDAGGVLTTDGAGTLSWTDNASEKTWAFMSRDASSGTNYIGGFYKFGATDDDFNPSVTFGTVNISYAAHFFLVQAAGGAGGTDTVIRVSGTTIDDQGNRATLVNVDITVDDAGVAGIYYETTEKWIGQITIAKQSGPDLLCNYGFAKYWDNNNTNFKVVGIEATWLGAKNDANPDIELLHHKITGWTYNNAAPPTRPTAIASMATDHNTEMQIATAQEGAWKRDNLNTNINGGSGEGTIVELITTTNRTYAIGNFLVRITPQ